MATTIDQAFTKQFEREVHEAYQRQGSKLRHSVRTTNQVKGSSTIFQKVGKGTASTKSTNGVVPVMNLAHSNVECVLQNYYAGDWVDHLDELKINIDERQVIASAGASALGRKTDEMIINALDTASANVISDANTGLTKDKVLEAFELFGETDVPDDGQRFAAIGWKQWSDLLNIEEFVNADYIGEGNSPYTNSSTQAKMWLGTIWIPHSGLPIDNDDIRSCYFYHKNAIGHAVGSDVQTDVSWHGGLDHLEGKEVTVIADGIVLDNPLVVTAGAITLDDAASDVEVGLPYTHILEPLPLAFNESSAGRKTRLIEGIFRVHETQSLRLDVGRGLKDVPLKQFDEDQILNTPPPTVSTDIKVRGLGWLKDGTKSYWKIEQDVPYQFTLLSVAVELKIND